MPTAVEAIFGADARPMEAAVARQEIIVKRFGKTVQEVNAEMYGAENAQMARNQAAIKALIAERAVAKAELERYNAALMANAAGLATVAGLNKAEDAELIRKSQLLKAQIAERAALRADAQRYAGTVGGGTQDARAMNAADQEAWLRKFAAAKGISVETLKAQQAMKEAEVAARGFAGDITKANGEMHGLSSIIREVVVIFRELGRGNFSRIPGSFSIILQRLVAMRAQLGILGAVFTATGLVVTLAIAAIVGAFFIWEYRVKSLTKALSEIVMPDLAPRDIGRLSAVEEGWKKITQAINEAKDAADSANEKFDESKAAMTEKQDTEKQLLEIQKQSDLQKAGDDPAARAKVRADYAQKEHDLQAKQMKEQEDADQKHIEDLDKEAAEKKAQADAIKIDTEEDAKATEKDLKDRYDVAQKYFKQTTDKKGKVTESQMTQDQETIKNLTAAKNNAGKVIGYNPSTGMPIMEASFTDQDQATLEAAQGRVSQAGAAMKQYEAFEKAKKDRDALRERQKQLYDEAAKAGADSETAKSALKAAKALNPQILANSDKIRSAGIALDAQSDEKKEQKASSHVSGHMGLNELQRIGAYAAMPDFQRENLSLLRGIRENTSHLTPGHSQAPHSRPTSFGPNHSHR